MSKSRITPDMGLQQAERSSKLLFEHDSVLGLRKQAFLDKPTTWLQNKNRRSQSLSRAVDIRTVSNVQRIGSHELATQFKKKLEGENCDEQFFEIIKTSYLFSEQRQPRRRGKSAAIRGPA
jgi:hypothetical protein